jgi:4-amino-4-deoxy-L-arabinose transferase-like glycosyltransferase
MSILSPAQPSSEPTLDASAWEKESARRLRWLTLALIVVGLAWRFTSYLLRFPVWGDEAMVLVNYFSKSYLDLLGPIDNCQVAPILFHWVERAAVQWLGTNELSVRLPPFLACLGSLLLFWRLAYLTLPPLARTVAVGILSVSIWPATLGALAKPYAGDLFFSLALLVPAVSWLRKPARLGWLVVLAALAPVAMLASYPAAFVGGAVAVALAPAVWRSANRRAMLLLALYTLLLAGTFAAHYLVVGRAHLASPTQGMSTSDSMHLYWTNGFPPSQPVAFLEWCFLAQTGQIAAYPLGAASGGSIVTVLLALVGAWHLHRHGRRRLLVLIGTTFALGFVAALFHKYPYGASCRLAQYLAPFWCLLAGLGVAVLIHRRDNSRARWKATLTVCGVLALVGAGGIVRDCVRPGRDDGNWARQVTTELIARAGKDAVLVAQAPARVNPVFHWQLGRLGKQVTWEPDIDWQQAGMSESSLWVFSCGGPFHDEQSRLQKILDDSGRPWRCAARKESVVVYRRPSEGIEHCRVYHWVCVTPPRPPTGVPDGS